MYTVDLANPALKNTTKVSPTEKIFFFFLLNYTKHVKMWEREREQQDVNEAKSIKHKHVRHGTRTCEVYHEQKWEMRKKRDVHQVHSVSAVNTRACCCFRTLFALSAVKQSWIPLTHCDPLLYMWSFMATMTCKPVRTKRSGSLRQVMCNRRNSPSYIINIKGD